MKESEVQARKKFNELGCNLIQVPMERRGMNPVKDVGLFTRYWNYLKKESPDYVITYTIKPNIYAGLACRLQNIPYAVNITGLGTAFQSGGMLQNLVVTLYKSALKKAKIIFFENNENRNKFIDLGIANKEKMHVLQGAGVDLKYFSYEKYPKENKEVRFLFMGRVMKEKGIDELFAAMRMLMKDEEKCSLHIVGSFEEDYSKKIIQYKKEGWLNYYGVQNDVRPFLGDSHCVVLPSWHEGMSNTNLEGAATGRPLITSNISGCKEAVIENISGFLCKVQSAENLYKVMKKFIGLSYEQKSKMGQEGRKLMEEKFDKEKVVEETIRIMGV